MYKIAFINQSTVVPDAEAQTVMTALQAQIDNDFSPIWELSAQFTFVPKGQAAPADQWWLVVMDNSDAAGALGYHDLTPTGMPMGKIFAGSDKQYGLPWSVTASHEAIEQIVDPYINLTVFNQSGDTSGWLYSFEACFSGDTLIPLATGETVRIDTLTEREEFSVYSATPDGTITIGRGHSCKKTRTNTKMVEVELDNGRTIRCTPDHPFMKRDGTYTAAAHLNSGDSLMPLYRRLEPIADGKNNHKVVSVRDAGFSDVYDFVVDDFHNFALDAGVFVHNCDACEDPSFGYPINGVLVSDFVTPAWFEGWRKPSSTLFDFKNHIQAPFTLLKGGYIGAFQVGAGTGWKQLTADAAPSMLHRAPVGSRRERRHVGQDRWVLSTV